MAAPMQMRSTAVKCTTVGLIKARIASRFLSVNTWAPIEAATNMSPTSVADAVQTWASRRERVTSYASATLVEFNPAADLERAARAIVARG